MHSFMGTNPYIFLAATRHCKHTNTYPKIPTTQQNMELYAHCACFCVWWCKKMFHCYHLLLFIFIEAWSSSQNFFQLTWNFTFSYLLPPQTAWKIELVVIIWKGFRISSKVCTSKCQDCVTSNDSLSGGDKSIFHESEQKKKKESPIQSKMNDQNSTGVLLLWIISFQTHQDTDLNLETQ